MIAMLFTIPLLAQYSPCFEAAFTEGKRLYNAGKLTTELDFIRIVQ